MAAKGQTTSNNDFGQCWESLVKGNKKNNISSGKDMGWFHKLPEELQRSLIATSWKFASMMGKDFDKALQRQFDARRRKEEIKLEKQYEDPSGEYIVAIYFLSNISHHVAGPLLRLPGLSTIRL